MSDDEKEPTKKEVHYRHKKKGKIGCLDCDQSEGDGATMLWCNLLHIQTNNQHICNEISESQASRLHRMFRKTQNIIKEERFHQSKLFEN